MFHMYRYLIILYVLCSILALSACGRKTVAFMDGDLISSEFITEDALNDTLNDFVDASEKQVTDGITPNVDGTLHLDTEEDNDKEVAVYVCGAVLVEGVYYLPAGSIKMDALNMAGGFVEGAASSYVNLAETVTEGEKIYFPYEEELEADYTPLLTEQSETPNASGKININTATLDELMTLPGIGKNKAEAIVKYRDSNRTFNNIEDIKLVPGIKDGVYNQINEYICVN